MSYLSDFIDKVNENKNDDEKLSYGHFDRFSVYNCGTNHCAWIIIE